MNEKKKSAPKPGEWIISVGAPPEYLAVIRHVEDREADTEASVRVAFQSTLDIRKAHLAESKPRPLETRRSGQARLTEH